MKPRTPKTPDFPIGYIAYFLSAELINSNFLPPIGPIPEKIQDPEHIKTESTQTRTGNGVMDVDIGRKG